jgi:hypothetical protein
LGWRSSLATAVVAMVCVNHQPPAGDWRSWVKLLCALIFVPWVFGSESRCLSLSGTESDSANDDSGGVCLGEVQLLGNRLNIGVHNVASFGTQSMLANESYYNNQLASISNIYRRDWADVNGPPTDDGGNSTSPKSFLPDDEAVLEAALPPFTGDFFFPGYPLECETRCIVYWRWS